MKPHLPTDAELMHELATAQAWPARKPRAGIKPPARGRFDSQVFAWCARLDANAPGTPEWHKVFAEARFYGRILDLATLRRVMRGQR